MKKKMKGIFLKLMFNILKNYITFTMFYHFYQFLIKIEKVEKLAVNLHDKTHMLLT